MSLPVVIGSYTTSEQTNSIFPAASSYTDGQLLSLLIGFLIIIVLVAWYLSGRSPGCLRYWDVVSSSYALVAPADLERFTPARRTSKFGGLMSVVAAVAAAALCCDILVSVSVDPGEEDSVTSPALDSMADAAVNGRVELKFSARKLTGVPGATCVIVGGGLEARGGLVASFVVSSQTDTGNGGCDFTVVAPTVSIASPIYPVATVPPAAVDLPNLYVNLGSGLQAVSWQITVWDAKPGAYTTGALNARWGERVPLRWTRTACINAYSGPLRCHVPATRNIAKLATLCHRHNEHHHPTLQCPDVQHDESCA